MNFHIIRVYQVEDEDKTSFNPTLSEDRTVKAIRVENEITTSELAA
jgi:hypothetical protein